MMSIRLERRVKGWFPRGELAKTGSEIVLLENVLLQASKIQCQTNRCTCFKAKILRDPQCHSSGLNK